jgi:hypothetical protein
MLQNAMQKNGIENMNKQLKNYNLHKTGIPERGEKAGTKAIFEEIMADVSHKYIEL